MSNKGLEFVMRNGEPGASHKHVDNVITAIGELMDIYNGYVSIFDKFDQKSYTYTIHIDCSEDRGIEVCNLINEILRESDVNWSSGYDRGVRCRRYDVMPNV